MKNERIPDRWTDEFLDEMRCVGDPVADEVKIQIPMTIGIKVTSETATEISVYNVLGEKVYPAVEKVAIWRRL